LLNYAALETMKRRVNVNVFVLQFVSFV